VVATLGAQAASPQARTAHKRIDKLVNDVSGTATGFDSDRNGGVFLTPESAVDLPVTAKTAMASRIFDETLHLRTTARQGVGTRP